jgi:hypothetical protein
MRKQLLALASLSIVLVAATPRPDPVITMKGVDEAVVLGTELRTAIEPRIEALNATLEKVAAGRAETPEAVHERRARMHEAMDGIHEIMKQLDPEQRAAFHAYLIAQLKAAGIEIHHSGHDGAAHPSHGHGSHEHHEHAQAVPGAAA